MGRRFAESASGDRSPGATTSPCPETPAGDAAPFSLAGSPRLPELSVGAPTLWIVLSLRAILPMTDSISRVEILKLALRLGVIRVASRIRASARSVLVRFPMVTELLLQKKRAFARLTNGVNTLSRRTCSAAFLLLVTASALTAQPPANPAYQGDQGVDYSNQQAWRAMAANSPQPVAGQQDPRRAQPQVGPYVPQLPQQATSNGQWTPPVNDRLSGQAPMPAAGPTPFQRGAGGSFPVGVPQPNPREDIRTARRPENGNQIQSSTDVSRVTGFTSAVPDSPPQTPIAEANPEGSDAGATPKNRQTRRTRH